MQYFFHWFAGSAWIDRILKPFRNRIQFSTDMQNCRMKLNQIGCTSDFWISHQLTFFRYQKSSKRQLRTQHRRVRIALAPGTLQCIPERFSLAPMAFLQPALTTPLDTHRPCARISPYRIRWRLFSR